MIGGCKMSNLKRLKYRHKIAIIIFIFTLLPMVIFGTFLTWKLWDSKVDEILQKTKSQLLSSVNGINNLLTSNEYKSLYINNNYYINSFLETDSNDNLVGIMTFNDYLQSVLLTINADKSGAILYIYSLKSTSYNGEYIRNIDGLGSAYVDDWESVKDEILGYADNDIIWKFRTLKGKQYNYGVKDYICVYKKIVTLKKPLAIIEIRIPFNKVIDYFQYDIPKGSFIVFDMGNGQKTYTVKVGDGNIESGLEQSKLKEIKGQQKDYYTINLDLKSDIGKISMFIPKNLIFQELKLYLIIIVATFLIITIILFFTVEIVAFYLTKRLEGLFLKMNTNVDLLIKNENFEIHAEMDEFGTLENKFHELIQKMKQYYEERNEYELERKSLETKLLQERFNPHFLYNTLSTLKWIIEDKRVENVIDSMVKYYRIALNKGSSIITIQQELEMLGEYLKLQKFAYGNENEYRINIEEGLGKYLILKHLLQPVVENAVLHGLSGYKTGGIIDISVKNCETDIVFVITDNGIGMEQEKVEKILRGITDQQYGGYGMSNLQKRMKVFYGEKYGIDIESIINQGTSVKITIPRFLDSDFHSSMK